MCGVCVACVGDVSQGASRLTRTSFVAGGGGATAFGSTPSGWFAGGIGCARRQASHMCPSGMPWVLDGTAVSPSTSSHGRQQATVSGWHGAHAHTHTYA